jgi:hypothetical protein
MLPCTHRPCPCGLGWLPCPKGAFFCVGQRYVWHTLSAAPLSPKGGRAAQGHPFMHPCMQAHAHMYVPMCPCTQEVMVRTDTEVRTACRHQTRQKRAATAGYFCYTHKHQ